jgi:gliding motility-associated-like protein
MTLSRSYAQRENVWVFGSNAGLNFNTGVPVAINTNIVSNEACASVCDANGQLLFYTNGERVWDQTNNFMQNGFNICSIGVGSTTQGTLIVPMPDSSSKYYIFSLAAIENGPGWWGRLYYSVVDMSLNNGLGAVVAGRKEILVDTGLQENMTAVAGKNCNIWLLTISQQGTLKAFNIDHDGIGSVPVQSPVLPGSGTIANPVAGSMCVSPNRNKLAIADIGLALYDFNAATGMVSNPLSLSTESFHYSVCFSPNSSKLYAIQFGSPDLKQYDLSSGIPAVIAGSMIPVNAGTLVPTTLKLGPDNKVYCSRPGASLGVIHQPDVAGIGCLYTSWSLQLNNNTFGQLGLPNVVPVIVPTGDTLFSTDTIDVAECFTETHQLQADTLGTGLVWEDGSTLPLRTVDGPGTYWVTYSKRCVVYSDTFIVRFPNAAPEVWIYGGCKGSSNGMAVAYTPNTGYTYTWRNAASAIVSTSDTLKHAAGGNYTLHVVTPSGCEATVTVSIPEEEHIASFRADSIVCQGTAVPFNNTSDSHFTQFEWTFGDGGNSSLQGPTHTYNNRGYYTATLIATGPVCIDTAYQTITVDSILNGQYSSGPDSICTGQSITFRPDTDSTILNLHWSYGDGTEMTLPCEPMLQHAYDSAGTLAVQLLTRYRVCPPSTFTDTVYVYPLPRIYLGPDTGLCLDGAPVFLQNLFPASTAASSNLWSTGDTAAGIKVVHPGTYSLTLRSGPLGCSATESVIVRKDCYVDIPNAFTPNGDGENDYFYPRQFLSRNVTRFKMQVFNRWGQLVFETSRTDGRGWDGRFNGTAQPQGVYVYMIEATIDNSREEKYNGNVTLIR